MATAAEVIPIAKIAQYLAADDKEQQTLLKGSFLRGTLARYIYIVRRSVEWLYGYNPSSSSLVSQANYLYWLCMPYVGRAKYILSQGGSGQIVNPATGAASSIAAIFYVGTVDGVSFLPMITGQTEIVIPDDFIQVNSIEVVIDTVDIVYGNYTDRLSYTVTYSTSQAIINIFNGDPNQGLQAPWVVMIRGQKFVDI